MTTKGYSVKHLKDTKFAPGLRPYLEYRYLGIKEATEGRVIAWHLRKIPGVPFPEGTPHRHHTSLQFVYVLKGWRLARLCASRASMCSNAFWYWTAMRAWTCALLRSA